MKELKDLITRALKYLAVPSGRITHLGGIQDDVILGQNNFEAGLGLLKEALNIKRRHHEINLISSMISEQVRGEACNSHKTTYMRKLAKDFGDKFEQTIENFDRESFFKNCDIREKL